MREVQDHEAKVAVEEGAEELWGLFGGVWCDLVCEEEEG